MPQQQSNELENIAKGDIKLNKEAEVELGRELQDAVAGGVSPEEEEEEGVNVGCNQGCVIIQK